MTRAITVIVVLCGVAVPARAQITSASVAGVVKDAQGGVIPGATVVLISEKRGTRTAPVVTSGAGDFVFANIIADTYTVEVTMNGFKTLRRTGVTVSPGDRLAIGSVTIEVGGTSEVVDVKAEAPQVQAASGERSFIVNSTQLENLPVASRSFQAYATLTPGVDSGVNRLGGGGGNNYMMDGVVSMDPGNGGPALQVLTESIAEVKVLTSSYQAEYGRASGLQITAVTKSGSNRFHGSMYDVERNSNWNPNSKTNLLNGDPKAVSKQRDWGFSVGGPAGKPGGHNKLFFFYAQEFDPRSQGNDVVRFRMPTALERQGDFSQTYDNTGALYPYIKDPSLSGACSAASRVACFADGGVLGRIPASKLYGPGLAVLNWWPMPTITGAAAAGLAYNYQLTRPIENALGWQPVIRVDYQPTPKLRLNAKYSAYGQRNQVFLGSLPGFTDVLQSHPVTPATVVSGNYNLNSTTFLEATWGHSWESQEGCAFTGGGTAPPGPVFCTGAIAQDPISNVNTAGFGNLPLLFPDARVLDPTYYAYSLLQQMKPPFWDGTHLLRAPTFSFGNRVANTPPGTPFPGYFQSGGTHDISVSVTKVSGRHTMKAGYYFQHELHYRNGGSGGSNGSISFSQDTVGLNPFDTSFGYANAAIGSFSSYTQTSKYLEGRFIYFQHEAYVQDNWKVNAKLTLDYGLRFVNERPYYDERLQASNFLPDTFKVSQSPVFYVAGCANGVAPCMGPNRQAMNPLTGQFLGGNSSVAIGTLVTGTGSSTNGLTVAGQGIDNWGFLWPAVGVAPRFGMAYDVAGNQHFVLRSGAGLYYDRPSANAAGTYNMIGNPPVSTSSTVRFGQLQTLGSGGLTTFGAPSLQANEYNAKLPASTQFDVGVQMVLPWAMVLDASFVGQHSFNTIQSVNINALDIGTAFLAAAQDPTVAVSTTPGASSFAATNPDLLRYYRGYAGITQRYYSAWRTYDSVQLSVNRRFRNGLSFGFNDTIGLSDKQNATPRLQHNPDGTITIRSDQAKADALLGDNAPQRHFMKANFVWSLPTIKSTQPAWRAIGVVVNDWQLSGIWTASTGTAYTVGFNYQNGGSSVNLTGSQEYAARILVVGDPGAGCSHDVYRQFTTSAFQGPLTNSVGLESGTSYLRGCFQSAFDLAIARNIRLGGGRSIQLRVDMFNAPNQAIVTGRNTTLQLSSPNDAVTNQAPVFDPITGLLNNGVNLLSTGALSTNRSLPKNAGFGVANAYQAPRSIQAQVRFSF